MRLIPLILCQQPPTTECIRATPSLDAKPDSSMARPGAPVQYLVTITNKDSLNCGETTFLLSTVLPSGFTGSYSSDSITLNPATSGDVSLQVTSPITQPDGTYSIEAHTSSSVDPIHSTKDTSVLIIDGTPPSAVTLSAKPARRYIDLTWTDAVDNNPWTGIYNVYRDNNLLAQTKSTIYRDYAVTRGITYSYYIIAEDSAGNQGPQSNTVQASLITRGKGK